MKSKYILLCGVMFFSANLLGQQWRLELDSHEGKPVLEIIKAMDTYFNEVGETRKNKHHHYLRWKMDAINHMNEDGTLGNALIKNKSLLRHLEKQESLLSKGKRQFHGRWESVNPLNFQTPLNDIPSMGRIDAMAISPSNPNVLYAGASGGGVWKTWNHGSNWFPLWDGMLQMGVSDILIDYTNENHIIVMSGSADGEVIPSSGIFESYDGGLTWNQSLKWDLDKKYFSYKMVQSLDDPNIIYLGRHSKLYTNGGLYKYNMSTGNFSLISSETDFIYDMEYQEGSVNLLFIAYESGLNVMDDQENVSSVPGLSFSSARGAISIAPSDQNYIYYLSAVSNKNYELYKATNGSSSFMKLMDYDTTSDSTLVDQITINFNLAVHPLNRDKVFIGSVKYSQATTTYANWTTDMIGMHADVHDIVFQNGRHYVCTDGGISYREVDESLWENINNGLLVTQFYKMDKKGSKLVGGTQDNGTLFWNEGDAVGIRKLGADGFDCQYHPSLENRLLLTTQEWLYTSDDNGDNYTNIIPHRWAAPIVHWQGVDNQVITFDKNNLRFSYNHGNSWPDSLDIFTESSVYLYSGFDQCDSNPSIAYATADKQVVKTTNLHELDDSDWNDVSPPLSFGLIYRNVLIHPTNCNEIYVTLAGYNQDQIWKSIDGGNSWTEFNQGLLDMPVYCIYYDHINGNGFYIGTELGVYYRNSSMSEWIPYSTYLPRVQVMDLNVTDTHVYAATFGRGMWKSEGYKNCETNLTLTQANDPTNGLPSGYQIHKASNRITSNRIITGRAGTDVKYQADNYVDLTEGFLAKQFNLFTARAAGCND